MHDQSLLKYMYTNEYVVPECKWPYKTHHPENTPLSLYKARAQAKFCGWRYGQLIEFQWRL